MLLVKCPFCGERDETEFTCGGELISRPEDALNASDQAWTDYLYFRDNRMGLHTEVWRHTSGCRQWFLAERNTVTHQIASTRPIGAQGDGEAADNKIEDVSNAG